MRENEIISYRYPGANPFELAERHLFFGRETDAETFYRLVKIHPLVVLYSKSGIGKSSLLNASVIPKIQEENLYEPFRIRFEVFTEGKKDTPLDILRKKIAPNGSVSTFLDKLIKDEPSLWHDIKEFQIQKQKGLILIFDQFEELFTYPAESILQFKQQLEETLYTVIPDRYGKVLEQFLAADQLSLTSEQIQLLQTPPEIKIIISIRSDRKYLLDKLADSLPSIQKTGYELNPLEISNARSAITEPAQVEDDKLASPVFSYADDALQEMLDFLTKSGTQKVEPFQLQILCNYLEQKVKEPNQVLTTKDLGDVSKIYENYYENQLNKIEDPVEREAARRLIEDGLILEEEERRLTLYEGQILRDYHIQPKTLYQLVNCRLLRSEPSESGGFMYELSHDSLVEPVLESKTRYLEAQQKIEAARQKAEAEKQRELERQEEAAKLARQQAIAEQERQLREEAQKNLRRARMWARIASGALVVLLLLIFYTLGLYMESVKSSGKVLENDEKYEKAIAIYEKAETFDFLQYWNMKEIIAEASKLKELKKEYYQYLSQADTLYNKGPQYYLEALELYQKSDSTGYPINRSARIKIEYIKQERERLFLEYLRIGDKMYEADDYETALENFKLAERFKPGEPITQIKIEQTQAKLGISQ